MSIIYNSKNVWPGSPESGEKHFGHTASAKEWERYDIHRSLNDHFSFLNGQPGARGWGECRKALKYKNSLNFSLPNSTGVLHHCCPLLVVWSVWGVSYYLFSSSPIVLSLVEFWLLVLPVHSSLFTQLHVSHALVHLLI